MHTDYYLNKVASYVRSNYIDNNKSHRFKVLLELDPNVKSDEGTFFKSLESKLIDADIIYGDKYSLSLSPRHRANLDKYREIEERVRCSDYGVSSSNPASFKDLTGLASSFFLAKTYHFLNCYDYRIMAKRNVGLNEVISDTNPDIVIVGAAHAFALKKMNSDANFSLLMSNNINIVDFLATPSLILLGLKYRLIPDNIWAV